MRGALALGLSCVAAVLWGRQRTEALPELGNVWRSVSPGGGGWVLTLTESRHVSGRLLVGSDVGGFYISEDGGRSYAKRNRGLKDMYVEGITEHPSQPNVLFAALRGGIYKSTDLGRTWIEKRSGIPPADLHVKSLAFQKIVFDPTDENVLYAAVGDSRTEKCGRGEFYRSDDGGETWQMTVAPGQLSSDVEMFDLVAFPKPKGRVLVATNRGLFRSEDAGVHWTPVNDGLPASKRTRKIGQCLARPDTLYVTLRHRGGVEPWEGGVYRSDDAGMTWRAVNAGLDQRTGREGAMDRMSAWYEMIAVHPRNPDVAWVSGATYWTWHVMKTTDGGRSWSESFGQKDIQGWGNFWGVSGKSMSVSPCNPDCVCFGTSGFIYRTEDGGSSWNQRYTAERKDGKIASTGYDVNCLHRIDVSALRPGRVFLDMFDVGLFVSEDGGKTLFRGMQGITPNQHADCYAVAEDPADPQHLWGAFGSWASKAGCIAQSFDGGRSWTEPTTDFVEATGSHLVRVTDCAPHALAYVTTSPRQGVVVSTDGGGKWRTVDEAAFPATRRTICLTAAKGILYAGTEAGADGPGAVWKSEDRGGTWTCLVPPEVRMGSAFDIAVKGKIVLVAARQAYVPGAFCSGGGWLSKDRGQTWTRVYDDSFCGAAAICGRRLVLAVSDHPSHDYAVGGGPVMSTDLGATWVSLDGPGLENWNLNCLASDPLDPDVLWAGTDGNSAFVSVLTGPVAKVGSCFVSGCRERPLPGTTMSAQKPCLAPLWTGDATWAFAGRGCGMDSFLTHSRMGVLGRAFSSWTSGFRFVIR